MKKAATMVCALMVFCGCRGHFDRYDPEEAYIEYIERHRPEPQVARFGKQVVVFPEAHLPGSALPGFTVLDTAGRFLSTFDCEKGAAVVVMVQRKHAEDAAPWLGEISTRYGRNVKIVPVLNLSQENWLNKSVLRNRTRARAVNRYMYSIGGIPGLPEETRRPGIDWRGASRDALALRGAGPYIVAAENGVIRGFFYGRATRERLLALRECLDAVATPVADYPVMGVDDDAPSREASKEAAPKKDGHVDSPPEVPAYIDELLRSPDEKKAAPAAKPDADVDILDLLP